eukprot:COSAG06_NODE_2991_length_5982_cov_9.192589_12_plen_76_part_00
MSTISQSGGAMACRLPDASACVRVLPTTACRIPIIGNHEASDGDKTNRYLNQVIFQPTNQPRGMISATCPKHNRS